jgi:hypothetical protein
LKWNVKYYVVLCWIYNIPVNFVWCQTLNSHVLYSYLYTVDSFLLVDNSLSGFSLVQQTTNLTHNETHTNKRSHLQVSKPQIRTYQVSVNEEKLTNISTIWLKYRNITNTVGKQWSPHSSELVVSFSTLTCTICQLYCGLNLHV